MHRYFQYKARGRFLNRKVLPGLVLPIILGAVPCPVAADWPEFRGPTGQGHCSGCTLPTEWGPDKNVVWKQSIPGLGWSSPIVKAGRVYLTTSVPLAANGGFSLRALCLDAASGRIV